MAKTGRPMWQVATVVDLPPGPSLSRRVFGADVLPPEARLGAPHPSTTATGRPSIQMYWRISVEVPVALS